jgi:hypothetical protein
MSGLTSAAGLDALSWSKDQLERPMRKLNLSLIAVLAAGFVLTACGGGVEVGVEIPPQQQADFDLGAKLNGQWLTNVDVFPDEQQTIQVQVGDVLELDSSGPVAWETVAGNSAGIPTQAGTTVLYGGAAFTETVSTPGQLVFAISSAQPLVAPVPLTIYATSLDDAYQTARIDLVVTN